MIIKTKGLFAKRQQSYSDLQVTEGLQQHERKMEEWFYQTAKHYFDEHFSQIFFDKDRKQEIFQSAFLKLWTEIDNKRICCIDQKVCRQQGNGEFKPMTCTLTTFLMAFARTEYRELTRTTKEELFPELYEDVGQADVMVTSFDQTESEEEMKKRIIDECIGQLSPNCAEILTLFYYNGKSLDEILEQRENKNSSKNGLKTAKNKCMNTLREKANAQFKKFNLTA